MNWTPARTEAEFLLHDHAGEKADPPIVLARTVQTALAVPSQWDAWTTGGQYLYLRYRFGHGTVDSYPGPDMETWDRVPEGNLACFGDCFPRQGFDGEISLAEFCERAGLALAPDTVVVSYGNPPVQCWHTEPETPCDWDVCRQPERLAAGDRGTDPARTTHRKEP